MAMILISLVFSISSGSLSEVSEAVFSGAERAVTLTISLLGSMAFWLGITEVAEKAGLTQKLNKVIFPMINFLFPSFKDKNEIKEKISLNITANLLGLGNAATPLGISAIDSMSKIEKNRDYPSKEIIMFVVMNTASLQLLPTNMAALRSSFGSEEPFKILIPVWIVSLSVMTMLIILCKCMGRRNELHR